MSFWKRCGARRALRPLRHCAPMTRRVTIALTTRVRAETHGRHHSATRPWADIPNSQSGAVLTRKLGLKVPRYQRPYTWTEREVRQLIQDLWRAYQARRDVLFHRPDRAGEKPRQAGNLRRPAASGDADHDHRLCARPFARAAPSTFQTLIMDGDQPRLLLREEDANFFAASCRSPGTWRRWRAMPRSASNSKDLLCAAARTIEDGLEELGRSRTRLVHVLCGALLHAERRRRRRARLRANRVQHAQQARLAALGRRHHQERPDREFRALRRGGGRRRAQMGADRRHVRARGFRAGCWT